MPTTTVKKKRRSRMGGVLDDVKEALGEESVNKDQNFKSKEEVSVSIPAAEVGLERKNYGRQQKVVVKLIDPSRCRPWRYHNRDHNWLNANKCSDLINSIKENGQLEPGGVRKIVGDPDYDYEIVYGLRRWFACKELKKEFKARVLDKNDRECMILMHIENADSQDITDFERAYSFKLQMGSGEFKSQGDMAKAFNLSGAMISKYLSAASIFDYDYIKNLLKDKSQISIRKAVELSKLLDNPVSRKAIKEKCIDLAKENVGVNKAFQILLSSDAPEPIQEMNLVQGVFAKIDSKGRFIFQLSPKAKKEKKKVLVSEFEKVLEEYLSS